MRSRVFLLFFIFLTVGANFLKAQQRPSQAPPEKTRVLFVFDASGSMFAEMDGKLRINVAKRLLMDMVDSLRVDKNLELALRVYGHQFPARQRNCEDSKLEVAFSPNNHDQIIQRVRTLDPKGNTPIAYSLLEAAKDFPKDDKFRNVLILITDGLESCDGDPCKISYEMQRRGVYLQPFILGVGAEESWKKEFECVGKFYEANDISSFRRALTEAISSSLKLSSVSIELLDENGRERVTDLPVIMKNSYTGVSQYDFVHFRYPNGRPDSVEVDPVINYDIEVSTIPATGRKNVRLKPGEHNVIRIPAPEGKLVVQLPGHTEYGRPVEVLIRERGKPQILHQMVAPGTEKLLQGQYSIELLTVPRTFISSVEVKPSQENTVRIPGPGLLNFNGSALGIGAIYQIKQDGTQEWVMNVPEQRNFNQALQPGNYKIVFRGQRVLGSKYTESREFKIQSGRTTSVKLFQ
ncbi:MAG: VWA domain-containing protein [Cyclobacteriaceae bacterium]|nr:VWA domain-containing protein [Cyclobacteriaceae bacterium]MCH8516211.1 VWA domain-containing protein [Cyclobacteriaceae bacterium]